MEILYLNHPDVQCRQPKDKTEIFTKTFESPIRRWFLRTQSQRNHSHETVILKIFTKTLTYLMYQMNKNLVPDKYTSLKTHTAFGLTKESKT